MHILQFSEEDAACKSSAALAAAQNAALHHGLLIRAAIFAECPFQGADTLWAGEVVRNDLQTGNTSSPCSLDERAVSVHLVICL